MSEQASDHVVEQFRDKISETDVALVEAINRRLSLVRQLFAYKAERGYELTDPAREDWMIRYLERCNGGPLAAEELRDLYRSILDLTKREVARLREEERAAV